MQCLGGGGFGSLNSTSIVDDRRADRSLGTEALTRRFTSRRNASTCDTLAIHYDISKELMVSEQGVNKKWSLKSYFSEPSIVVQVLALFVIALLSGLSWVCVGVADSWLYGYISIIVFYVAFALVMFAVIRPAAWEGSVVFLFFTGMAIVFILLYSGLYHQHDLAASINKDVSADLLNGFTNLDCFYFSTSVFTTLGFGDILPTSIPGKIVVASEAVMGMTYGATALITFLGHRGWAAARGDDLTSSQPPKLIVSADVLALQAVQLEQSALLKNLFLTVGEVQEDIKKITFLLRPLIYVSSVLAAVLLLMVGWYIGRMMS